MNLLVSALSPDDLEVAGIVVWRATISVMNKFLSRELVTDLLLLHLAGLPALGALIGGNP